MTSPFVWVVLTTKAAEDGFGFSVEVAGVYAHNYLAQRRVGELERIGFTVVKTKHLLQGAFDGAASNAAGSNVPLNRDQILAQRQADRARSLEEGRRSHA